MGIIYPGGEGRRCGRCVWTLPPLDVDMYLVQEVEDKENKPGSNTPNATIVVVFRTQLGAAPHAGWMVSFPFGAVVFCFLLALFLSFVLVLGTGAMMTVWTPLTAVLINSKQMIHHDTP